MALFARDPERVNWWSAAVQWVGTLEFNLSTFAALVAGLSASQEKRLVWSPDFYGSALFLASSVLALVAVGMVVATRRDRGHRVAEHDRLDHVRRGGRRRLRAARPPVSRSTSGG